VPEKKHIFDDPRNVRRVLWALLATCGFLLIADFIFHRHVVHPWEALWGFYALFGFVACVVLVLYALFGFVACVVLVLVAKGMRKYLMRKEDYYDDD